MNTLRVGGLTVIAGTVWACSLALGLGFLLYHAVEGPTWLSDGLGYLLIAGLGVATIANFGYVLARGTRFFGADPAKFALYRGLVKQTEALVAMAPSFVVTAYVIVSCVYLPLIVLGFVVGWNWILLGLTLWMLCSYVSFKLFQPPWVVLLANYDRESQRLLERLNAALAPHRCILVCPSETSDGGALAKASASVWRGLQTNAIRLAQRVLIMAGPGDSAVVDGALATVSAQGATERTFVIGNDARADRAGIRSMTPDQLLRLAAQEQWNRKELV